MVTIMIDLGDHGLRLQRQAHRKRTGALKLGWKIWPSDLTLDLASGFGSWRIGSLKS